MGRKGYGEREKKDNEKKSTLRKYKKNVKSGREKGMQKGKKRTT